MHYNLRPPQPRQPVSALLRRHAKFDVAEPIRCRIIAFLLLYAVTLTFDLSHLTLNICSVSPVT